MATAVGESIALTPLEDAKLRPEKADSTAVPDELQTQRIRSRASASGSENVAEDAAHEPTKAEKRAKLLYTLAVCWMMILIGWNDGTAGPLLPRIQSVYNIGYLEASLIFVSNCVGIVCGGMANIWLARKLALGKIVAIAASFSIIGFSIQAPAPPFPVFAISAGITGFSMTIQDIHANNFIASMKDSGARLGVLHCLYGIGAFAAPLASTHFADAPHWSFMYLCSLGIAASNVVSILVIFRLRTQDELLHDMGERPEPEEETAAGGNVYKQVLGLRVVQLLALFIAAYVGVETTIGGWIVSYTIDVRGGGPSAGYISSGFFGGLALGRVALLWITKVLGNRTAIFLYMILALGLEFIVWFVPSIVSGGVAISLAGLVLGPVFPIVVHQASHLLPRSKLNGAISAIATGGTIGSAAIPFVAGALAQGHGIWSLQPLLVSLMAVMISIWVFVPKPHARTD
ncbi:unnamed protein product [Peniophora sp. CBMAI 1063]|nr:unnamed protein product [Peniophora sp. CBMAI 1063]